MACLLLLLLLLDMAQETESNPRRDDQTARPKIRRQSLKVVVKVMVVFTIHRPETHLDLVASTSLDK